MIALYTLAEMRIMDRRMTGSALTGKGEMRMVDREKVKKGLKEHGDGRFHSCDNCPYANSTGCQLELCSDALALLEEQEPVRPEREHSGGGTTWWNVCGNCRTAINPNDKYCHECGRTVKWDG